MYRGSSVTNSWCQYLPHETLVGHMSKCVIARAIITLGDPCYEIITIYVTYRRSAQGNTGTQDWSEINAEHKNRWTESGAVDVVVPAGQYDNRTYREYLLWYRSRMCASLLSGSCPQTLP